MHDREAGVRIEGMAYDIRTVRAEDWAELKKLRLAALDDPAARVAFIETHAHAAARSDDFWRDRATPLDEGGTSTHLIAVDEDGTWAGMLVLLDETDTETRSSTPPGAVGGNDEAGGEGGAVPPQVHVASVYVHPARRGTGVAAQLLRAAVEWACTNTSARRVCLWVHGDNSRALAFYTRAGFRKTGATMAFPPIPMETEYELELPLPPRTA